MGVSAHASLRVGFEVTHDDFWETWEHTDDFLSCPEGHTEGAKKGKHCSDCGAKFDFQKRETTGPTENFKKFCESIGAPPASSIPPTRTSGPKAGSMASTSSAPTATPTRTPRRRAGPSACTSPAPATSSTWKAATQSLSIRP